MTSCFLYFKPEEFYPVPEGTILRYLMHEYDIKKQRYGVVMEVIGECPKDIKGTLPQIILTGG